MSRFRLLAVLVALLVLGAVVGIAIERQFDATALASSNAPKAELGALKVDTTAPEPATRPAAGATVNVPTAPAEAVTRDASIRLTGSLMADERADVASKADGVVEKVFVERGSIVEEGDVLVQVDATDAKNRLAEGLAGVDELKASLGWDESKGAFRVENQPQAAAAKASLDWASLNLKRTADLQRQGVLSKSDLDRAQSDFDAAQQHYLQAVNGANQLYRSYQTALTRVKMLKKVVDDTTVRAPFSGWVVERYVSVGERVTTNPMGSGSKVVALVKLDPLRLQLTVPQQYSTQVKSGQPVKFQVDGLGDRSFSGQVRYVAPSLEASSRSLTVEALVPNPDRTLRPGLFATAELLLPSKTKTVVVPASAVVKQEDVASVFVVRDGVARQQVASLGATVGDRVEVTSGVSAGDVVVTAPARVHDGDRIG